MITLYSYPELFGVADNNGYGLKVFAFLKLAGQEGYTEARVSEIRPGATTPPLQFAFDEAVYVLEGRGYDLHQDCDVEITDTYHWEAQAEVKRYEWEAGDVIYIPPNTIQQHFNADAERPVRLISAINRIYRHCGLNDLEQLATSSTAPAPAWSVDFLA